MRLNAPLKPALALGAERVIVIGLHSSHSPAQAPARPDTVDGAAQLLQVALADQLANDVATLAGVNEALGSRSRTGTAHRCAIPYIFVAPSDLLRSGRLRLAISITA